MTKDDIKKALTRCSDISIPCNDCPYDALGNCNDTLCADALKLIIEQEKEIERLKDDHAKLQEQFAQYQMASDKEIKAQIKQAQIDILNKANERLNVVSREFGDDCDLCGVSAVCSCRCEINNLIKEVQNGKDKS